MTDTPQNVPQVMVSSTFTDLEEHRAAIIKAINKHKLHPNVMEHDDAKVGVDVIESSMTMVRESAAYVLVIGKKYGQTPECPDANPDDLSITELEFNEADRLGRPKLLYIMGEDHLVLERNIEPDPDKKAKLNAFRERAKKKRGSKLDCVYATFDSLEQFKEKLGAPLNELCQHLAENATDAPPHAAAPADPPRDRDAIPKHPEFYAEPDYIGSHDFVGRRRELEDLSDWAKPADPTNLLLFEAIGGNGKSMLTWEWTRNHSMRARPADGPWAGRFWYSFYERGAIMADFCQRALAYMTGTPLKELRKKKTAELREPLLAELHDKPWLLILDGLERVLVAYHRIDAAEMRDEDADNPTDQIASRNPRDAIREEDNDLLRSLAAARPSKILVSSRLTPRVLLNQSGQSISGVKRVTLTGLRPTDAEKLLKSCNVDGDSAAIQNYLATNCDNHPLVIGILAGLINRPGTSRGNFDKWAADPEGGAQLNLAELNLTERRNDILRAAIDTLSPESRQLLSTLALLSESVDFETISAFNPHDPPDENRLAATIADLEQRGLLQYDRAEDRYDLHPVVRGVASGGMRDEEKNRYGQRVLDHFNSIPHSSHDDADTLDDLRPRLNVVRTLLRLGRISEAVEIYWNDLSSPLRFNLEAPAIVLSLLRPVFPRGWACEPEGLREFLTAALMNEAGWALLTLGEAQESSVVCGAALRSFLDCDDWSNTNVQLFNVSASLVSDNRLASALRINELDVHLALAQDSRERQFKSRLSLFYMQSLLGRFAEAEETWRITDPMGRDWDRQAYRPGVAELDYAFLQFQQGALQEAHLTNAEQLAIEGKDRRSIRGVGCLRGIWLLELGKWELASASLAEVVRMARESGIPDAESETALMVAKHHQGQPADPADLERLAEMRKPAHRYLAMLWLELGNADRAKHHALAAYRWAWADGEPYVNRYELNKTIELLEQMGVEVPKLPPYDPANDEPFEWEADVRAAIEKLRAKKEAKEREADEGK